MNAFQKFPPFDEGLPFLDQFILELVKDYHAEKISSWDELDESVKAFFIPERMEQVELIVPGWKKMSSYSNSITLTHVMCVFLGLIMLPEFQELTPEQQQLAKWIVLFHAREKEPQKGKRDPKHGFRSAVITTKQLPDLGLLLQQNIII